MMLQMVQERRGALRKQSPQQTHRDDSGLLLDLLAPDTHACLLAEARRRYLGKFGTSESY
jgi:hypothetical protein